MSEEKLQSLRERLARLRDETACMVEELTPQRKEITNDVILRELSYIQYAMTARYDELVDLLALVFLSLVCVAVFCLFVAHNLKERQRVKQFGHVFESLLVQPAQPQPVGVSI